MKRRCYLLPFAAMILLAGVGHAEIPAVKFDPPAVKFPKVQIADIPAIPFAFAPSDFSAKEVPQVPALRAGFQSGDYHAGHQCPNPSCRASQYAIAGWLPNGQHRHVCDICRTAWRH